MGAGERAVSGSDFQSAAFLQGPDQGGSSKVPRAQEVKRHSPFGALAKSKQKFGLKVLGSWEDLVATGMASGKSSLL